MRNLLRRTRRKPIACRHDTAAHELFESGAFKALLEQREWPEEAYENARHEVTELGTHVLRLPLTMAIPAGGSVVLDVAIALYVVNETPAYGVLGLLIEGDPILAFRDFAPDVALSMQQCPRPRQIIATVQDTMARLAP